MGWGVDYIADRHIVELTLTGRLSGAELQEAALARIALGEERAVTNFVIDAQDLIAPRSATMSVYDIPSRIYVEKNVKRTTRIAVVVPTAPESAWIVQFFEDLCVNRGWRVHMAPDRETAFDWLHEDRD